jgi:hypothetical protein
VTKLGKSAPQPPDPKQTAAASTSTNVGTAISNAFLGNVNQVTPQGTLTYDQTGSYNWSDPYTGRTYPIPTFTATQTYSPEQAKLNETNLQTQQNLSDTAKNESAFLQNYLANPSGIDASAVTQKLFDLGRQRLDPMFAQQQQSLDAKLANQGITLGSDAYKTAQTQQAQNQNDAYNSLLLKGWGQAEQQAMAERNQPINEITALMSGSQVSQPNFVNTNEPTIPTTDVAGIINQNYQQKLAAWQQQQASMGGILGGLFKLGGSLLM